MQMSDDGVAMLTTFEGAIPYAYNDPLSYATFGVGHLLHRSPVTASDRAKWGSPSHPASRSKVTTTLKKDLKVYETAVMHAVRVHVNQNEFDAMVSLCFNIGTGGFASSTVVRKLNAGDRKGAADAFLLWSHPSMLLGRRKFERALFLKYTPQPTLRKGATGPHVRHLQRLIWAKGWKITIDGKFDHDTEFLVKKIQRNWHLTADGIVGPKTWDVMTRKLNKHRVAVLKKKYGSV